MPFVRSAAAAFVAGTLCLSVPAQADTELSEFHNRILEEAIKPCLEGASVVRTRPEGITEEQMDDIALTIADQHMGTFYDNADSLLELTHDEEMTIQLVKNACEEGFARARR